LFTAARFSLQHVKKNPKVNLSESDLENEEILNNEVPSALNNLINTILLELENNFKYYNKSMNCVNAKEYLSLLQENGLDNNYYKLHLIAQAFEGFLDSVLRPDQIVPRIDKLKYYEFEGNKKDEKYFPYRRVYYENIVYFHAIGIREIRVDSLISLIYSTSNSLYSFGKNEKMKLLNGILHIGVIFDRTYSSTIILFFLMTHLFVHPEQKLRNEANAIRILLSLLLQRLKRENSLESLKMSSYLEKISGILMDSNNQLFDLDNIHDILEIIQLNGIKTNDKAVKFVDLYKTRKTIPDIKYMTESEIYTFGVTSSDTATGNDWLNDKKEILGNYSFERVLQHLYKNGFPCVGAKLKCPV
jgi:hypothetical protein